MDFDSLARKDLQALCKLNKIPANLTNVAMAQALKSLEIVEGIEEILNRSPERNVATAAKVPRTGRRTCTGSKPIGDESSQSVQPMAKSTRRTMTRAISDEIMEESKTPAVRSSRKATNLTEVSTVQRVYSTRRSVRLTEQKEEKIDALATELSKIDLVDVTDDTSLSAIDTEIVLQEAVTKSDEEALEVVSNIKDSEFNDQKAKSEKILKAVDELNAVQVDITNRLVIENENAGIVKEEIVDGLKEKAEQLVESHFIADSLVINNQDNSGYAMDTENPHEQVHNSLLESRTDLTHLRGDNDPDKIVDELKEESEQLFDSLDESHLVHEVNVNNMVIEEKNEDENVKESLMDSDNPHKQLKLGVVEEYKYSNMESDVSATVDSSAGDSYLLEHMTCSEVFKAVTLDINDPKDYADKIEPSIVDFQESNVEILTDDLKDVATGKETSSVASSTKAPSSRVSDSVSDDKENIDRSEMKLEPEKVETKKNKKESASTELNVKSLRELTKMLKEKLQISNDNIEEIGDEVKACATEA
ncbi:hypothetical protein POM88_009224 [Heracleum sosnowskyi]|uniref:Uncharacterized protein n=1 Tax=Heracleum sosnowskyi TaxID=360622 RepID=A0AAD8N854_9APIA|nr:hypothetical protein POM88_009224 [Heracleum sosnowskyi]